MTISHLSLIGCDRTRIASEENATVSVSVVFRLVWHMMLISPRCPLMSLQLRIMPTNKVITYLFVCDTVLAIGVIINDIVLLLLW